jgi:hypothetical protein
MAKKSSSNKKDPKIITYKDLKKDTSKPQKERTAINIGRQGKAVVPRKMHLSEEEMKRLEVQAKATGGTINPFGLRKTAGLYFSQVEALIQLGTNEFHHCADVIAKIKEIMTAVPKKARDGSLSNAWEASMNRSSGRTDVDPSNRKSMEGKIEQNFKVLQRLGKKDRYPYGEKLRQFLMSIEIEYRLPDGVTDVSFVTPHFMLKTDWANEEDVDPSCNNPYIRRGRRKKNKTVEVPKEEPKAVAEEVIEEIIESEPEDIVEEVVEEIIESEPEDIVEEVVEDIIETEPEDEVYEEEVEEAEYEYDADDDDDDEYGDL